MKLTDEEIEFFWDGQDGIGKVFAQAKSANAKDKLLAECLPYLKQYYRKPSDKLQSLITKIGG